MANVTIWHNPRCSKSRNAAKLLEERGVEAEVVKYLETPPSKEEIKAVLKMLGISARELMRTKEAIYKELGLKDVDDEEKLIEAMVEHPRLIERPIVIRDGKAVIGRPPEKVIELVKGTDA
jgi:arsenate reductase